MSYGKWQRHRRPNEMNQTLLKPLLTHTHLHPAGQRQSSGHAHCHYGEMTNPPTWSTIQMHLTPRPSYLAAVATGFASYFHEDKAGHFPKELNQRLKGSDREAVLDIWWFCLPGMCSASEWFLISLWWVTHPILSLWLGVKMLSSPASFRGGYLILFWPMGILSPLDQMISSELVQAGTLKMILRTWAKTIRTEWYVSRDFVKQSGAWNLG